MFALHAVKSGHQFCTLLDWTRKTNQDTDMQMPCFSRSFYLDLSVRTWMGIGRDFNIAYDVLQCEPTKSPRRAIDIQSFTIAQASKQSWSHEICEITKRFFILHTLVDSWLLRDLGDMMLYIMVQSASECTLEIPNRQDNVNATLITFLASQRRPKWASIPVWRPCNRSLLTTSLRKPVIWTKSHLPWAGDIHISWDICWKCHKTDLLLGCKQIHIFRFA